MTRTGDGEKRNTESQEMETEMKKERDGEKWKQRAGTSQLPNPTINQSRCIKRNCKAIKDGNWKELI